VSLSSHTHTQLTAVDNTVKSAGIYVRNRRIVEALTQTGTRSSTREMG